MSVYNQLVELALYKLCKLNYIKLYKNQASDIKHWVNVITSRLEIIEFVHFFTNVLYYHLCKTH